MCPRPAPIAPEHSPCGLYTDVQKFVKFQWIVKKPAPKAHPIWPKGVPRAVKQQPRRSLWRPHGPSGGEVPPQMPPQIFQQPLRTQTCPPVYGRFIRHAGARRVLCEMHDSSLSLLLSVWLSSSLYNEILNSYVCTYIVYVCIHE